MDRQDSAACPDVAFNAAAMEKEPLFSSPLASRGNKGARLVGDPGLLVGWGESCSVIERGELEPVLVFPFEECARLSPLCNKVAFERRA